MHPYRGIVLTNRRWYGLYTIPDDSNTLTRQSVGTSNTPREPICGPFIWNPARHGPNYVYVYGYVYSPTRHHNHCKQRTLRCYVNIPPLVMSYWPPQSPSLALAVSIWSLVLIWFDSSFSMKLHSVFITQFDSRFLTGSDSDFSNLIWLTFNATVLYLIHVTLLTFQLVFRSPTLSRVS